MNGHLTSSVLVGLLLGIGSTAGAQPRALTNTDDVQACQPLSKQRVLLGTGGGLLLASADGKSRRHWTRLNGLPGTRVHALLREGNRVWVGTERGLAQLDLVHWRLKSIVVSKPVRAIARHQGSLYLGTWDGGLLRLDGARLLQVKAKGAVDGPGNRARRRITSLVGSGSTLLVGTAGGGLWKLVDTELHPMETRLPSPFVWSLASTPKGPVYVGTLAGLVKVQGSSVELLSSADARALLVGSRLWVGTYGAGIGLLEGRGLVAARGWKALHRVGYVNAIGSADGATCIGTRAGAWLSAGDVSPRQVRLSGPPSNDIASLAVEGDRLYVGTFDGGLAVLEKGAWRRIEGVDRRVDVLALQGQTLWAGTSRGLYRVRPGSETKRFATVDGLRHQHVHSLVLLRDGSLLVGTGRGAAIIRGDHVEQITVKQGLPVASVWAAVEDKDGGLWLGTSRGLYHWSRALRRYTRYTVASGHLKDDWVTALTLHRGTIYVGTYNAGVSRLTRAADSKWQGTHLGGGWVNFAGLRVVGKTLYAACMSGLYRLPVDKEAQFKKVNRVAPGRDITVVAPNPSGGIWVASRRGLALHSSL